MTSQPRTDQQLDEIEDRAAALYEFATVADPEGQAALDQLAGTDVPALIDELRQARAETHRLRTELATARSQAIDWAADVIDAKLTAEPDHNRASALYELLLHLRGELSCTCARTGGLHAKDCRKYVPGHELISRHNALARYRSERAAVETHVVADDSNNPKHTDTEPAEACGKCRRPFDPTDTAFDGRARYYLTPYCRSCVSRCHESTDAFHRCVICE